MASSRGLCTHQCTRVQNEQIKTSAALGRLVRSQPSLVKQGQRNQRGSIALAGQLEACLRACGTSGRCHQSHARKVNQRIPTIYWPELETGQHKDKLLRGLWKLWNCLDQNRPPSCRYIRDLPLELAGARSGQSQMFLDIFLFSRRLGPDRSASSNETRATI